MIVDKDGKDDRKFVTDHIVSEGYGRRIRILTLDKEYASVDLRRGMGRKGIHVNMQTKRGDYTGKRGQSSNFTQESTR